MVDNGVEPIKNGQYEAETIISQETLDAMITGKHEECDEYKVFGQYNVKTLNCHISGVSIIFIDYERGPAPVDDKDNWRWTKIIAGTGSFKYSISFLLDDWRINHAIGQNFGESKNNAAETYAAKKPDLSPVP